MFRKSRLRQTIAQTRQPAGRSTTAAAAAAAVAAASALVTSMRDFFAATAKTRAKATSIASECDRRRRRLVVRCASFFVEMGKLGERKRAGSEKKKSSNFQFVCRLFASYIDAAAAADDDDADNDDDDDDDNDGARHSTSKRHVKNSARLRDCRRRQDGAC